MKLNNYHPAPILLQAIESKASKQNKGSIVLLIECPSKQDKPPKSTHPLIIVPMEVVRSGKRMGTASSNSTSLAVCVVLPHRSTPSKTMKHPRVGAAAVVYENKCYDLNGRNFTKRLTVGQHILSRTF